MTARSVVLSVLLGAHPAWATAAELLRLTADFGIREPTVRVALTRMVSARRPGSLRRRLPAVRPAAGPAAAPGRRDATRSSSHGTARGPPWSSPASASTPALACRAANHAAAEPVRRAARRGVAAARQPRGRAAEGRHAAGPGAARARRRPRGTRRAGCGTCRDGRERASALLDDMATATDTPGRFVAAGGHGAPPAHRPGAARRAAADQTGPAKALRDSYFTTSPTIWRRGGTRLDVETRWRRT